MLNWVQSWSKWDKPAQDVKTREGKRKILLSTDIAEDTLSCFLGQVTQRKKSWRIYVTGEANIGLNGTSVCGSKLHSI